VQLKFLGFWAATQYDTQPVGGKPFNIPSGGLEGPGTSGTCNINGIYGFSHSDAAAYSGGTLKVNYEWRYNNVSQGGVQQWTVNNDPTWYGFRLANGAPLLPGNYGLTIRIEGSSSSLGGTLTVVNC
jgi:hypothetical protein